MRDPGQAGLDERFVQSPGGLRTEGTTELSMALETGQAVQFRHKTPPSIESGYTMHLQMSWERDLARNSRNWFWGIWVVSATREVQG